MASSPFKPVYVLHGDDEYLRDEQRRRIVHEVVGPGDPQLAVSTFDADAPLADVLNDLRTLPLMAPCRLVIVRDADAFVTAHRAELEAYLEKPSPTAALLLVVNSWQSTTNLYKQVARIGEAVNCSAPAGTRLGQWIAEAAAKRAKKIDPDASRLLEEYVGADLAVLDMEVEKLSLYAGSRPAITAADVNLLTLATAEPGNYALTNALRAADAKTALAVLDKTLTRKGLEFMVLGGIGWHLRTAIAAQTLRQAGQDPGRALVRLPYDVRPAYLELLKRRPLARLQADFRRVLAADLAMKSGGEPRAVMQDLVVALCA